MPGAVNSRSAPGSVDTVARERDTLAPPCSCPKCETQNRPEARFCDGCGAPVARAAAESRPVRDYTPRHLIDKVLATRSALEGERKQVTVLFADVKGSLELSRAVDPLRRDTA